MPSVTFFQFTDAENFHFKFLSPRSGVEKKSWLLFLNPLKLHLWHPNGFFFSKQDVGLTVKQPPCYKRKQKLIRDLSKRKTIGFAHPEQIGWI